MRGRREERIEKVVDHVAAAALGVAAGFCLFFVLRAALPQPAEACLAVASGCVCYWLSAQILGRVGGDARKFTVSAFDLPSLAFESVEELVLTDADRLQPPTHKEADELLLTEADRLQPSEPVRSDELVLNDILAQLGPDSRVVRLFDPAAMPTPGQLSARIERHLRPSPTPVQPADASQALYDALTELRRSLR
jgi:hypothetical protein